MLLAVPCSGPQYCQLALVDGNRLVTVQLAQHRLLQGLLQGVSARHTAPCSVAASRKCQRQVGRIDALVPISHSAPWKSQVCRATHFALGM